MPVKKINIPASFDRIDECWSPHVAGRVNGQEIRLAKIEGAFEWHRHDGVEEAFFVIKGGFVMRFRDDGGEWGVPLEEGDFITVPSGAEHMPVAEEECWIMLIETAGTLNTGEHVSERTKRDLPQL
ncbi:MAG: cupin domain-containing protein [Oricola sp.]|nr:cupin domain-containing protein [Oricola sp.]